MLMSAFWWLFTLYLLVSMNLLSAKAGEMLERNDVPWFWRVIARPWSYFGVAFSVALNLSVGWLLFIEKPFPVREWMFSNRVRRHYWFPDADAPVVLRKIRVWMAKWCYRHLNAVREGHI